MLGSVGFDQAQSVRTNRVEVLAASEDADVVAGESEPNAEQATDRIQRGCHVGVEVGVHTPDDGAGGLYDGHVAIPSVAFMVKGWHALAGTADGDRVACARGFPFPPPDR